MIKKPNEIIKDATPIKMIIYGFPGTGKTTLALSAPNPLLIDADMGAKRVNPSHRKDTIQPNSYNELLEDLTFENVKSYETLIFDTGGILLDLMKPYVISLNYQNGQKNGTLTQKGYGAVKQEFSRLINFAYYQLKKNIILIFHANEEKDKELTKIRIMIEGQTKETIWHSMDLGGFIEMNGRNKTISFDSCERYFAKGSHGIYGIHNIPELTFNKSNDFLTNLFNKFNQNIIDETELFKNQQAEYNSLMESFDFNNTDPNILMKQILSAKHILTSEKDLREKFKKMVASQGLIFNNKTHLYEKKINSDSSQNIVPMPENKENAI